MPGAARRQFGLARLGAIPELLVDDQQPGDPRNELRDVVRRRLEQDRLQLVTIGKELSFRLTDFVSEYAFPSYSFKGDEFQLKYIKQRQDMLLKQEGFADHIKPNQ